MQIIVLNKFIYAKSPVDIPLIKMSSGRISKKAKLSFDVDDLPLNPQIIQKLKEAKFHSYLSVLHLSEYELKNCAKLSASECKILHKTVAQMFSETIPDTAFSLQQDELNPLKLSIELLQNNQDNCDGIYTSTITEICGESGCGKTQLCMHLSIHAQKPIEFGGLNSRVMYIHSEGDFPIKRYLQMSEAFKRNHPEFRYLKLTDNLILKKALSVPQLMHTLEKGLPDLLQKPNSPKLIIIDSVAALLRSEYDTMNERTNLMKSLAVQIWKIAKVYRMAVICVNQVSGCFQSNQTTGIVNMDVPSLGLLWSNILTTRLRISRKKTDLKTRVLEVVFSSYHAPICNDFTISEDGIVF